MFLLDTDIFSDYRRQKERATALVRRVDAEVLRGRVYICDITMEESIAGALRVINTLRTRKDWAGVYTAYRFLRAMIADLAHFPQRPYDPGPEALVAEWTSGYKRKPTADMRIAAFGVAHNLAVVTRNRKDFSHFPGIRLEDWSGDERLEVHPGDQ